MLKAFLDALYPSGLPTGTSLLLWSRKPSPSCPTDGAKAEKKSWWCKSISEAVNLLARQVPHKDSDWYLGNGLANGPKGTHQRAKANEIVAIPGLWIDADIADPGHKKQNLPQSIDHALALLGAMPFPPTLVVHSGGGLQAWTLFDKPWVFQSPEDHAAAAALSESWNKLFIAICAKQGLTADSVHDLSRVFRLPGTWNVKLGIGDLARPTTLLSDGGPRFSVEEVADGVRGAEATIKPQAAGLLGDQGARDGHGSGTGHGRAADAAGEADDGGSHTQPGPTRGDGICAGVADGSGAGGTAQVHGDGRGNRVHTHQSLRQDPGHLQGPGAAGSQGDGCQTLVGTGGEGGPGLLQIVEATIDNLCTIPKFEATWDRRRGFNDNSLSSYDGALALFCVNLDVEDRVIAEIIRQFRVRHGKTQDEVAKGSRADYIERTIRTAKQTRAESERERKKEDLARMEAVMERREARKEETKAKHQAADDEKQAKRAAMEEIGIVVKRGPKPTKNRSSAIDRLLAEYQAAEVAGESESQRTALLDEICVRMGAKIERLVCYKAEPSSYVLHVEGEAVTLGGIESLHNYGRLTLKVADAGVYLPRKLEGWDSIFRAIHTLRENVLVGEDGSDRGFMENCVEGYLQGVGRRIGADVANAVSRHEPFVKNGEVFVILSALRDNVRDLQILSQKAVAAALVQWGAQPKLIAYTRAEGDSIMKTSTRAYLLPDQDKWSRYIAKPVVSTGRKLEGEEVG